MHRAYSVRVRCAYQIVYRPSEVSGCRAAYAVTNLKAYFSKNDEEGADEMVMEFVDEFKANRKRFYNLKKIEIYAPYAIMEGETLKELVTCIPSTSVREVGLELFAFHTPVAGMWIPSIEKFNVTFHDGICFPDSGSMMMHEIEKNEHLRELSVNNESPHNPVVEVPRKMRKKLERHSGVRIVYV